jgi:hypothetical protein
MSFVTPPSRKGPYDFRDGFRKIAERGPNTFAGIVPACRLGVIGNKQILYRILDPRAEMIFRAKGEGPL